MQKKLFESDIAFGARDAVSRDVARHGLKPPQTKI